MNKKVWMASAAAVLLALGSAVAGAREMGGGGGGHPGGGMGASIGGGGHPGGGHPGAGVRSGPGHLSGSARGPSFSHSGRYADYGHHHHGHRGTSIVIGAPYYDYYDYGYYGGDCGWLYRRAVVTGSSYWWNRYEACVG